MIETEEELFQEYADTHSAAGGSIPILGKETGPSVPKSPATATIKILRRRALLIAILLIFVISFLAWFYARNSIDRQTTAVLDEAYTGGRPLESRITGLKYAPFAITRGEKDEVRSAALRQTELNLLDAVINDRSARNLHAQGRFYLAKGDLKQAIEGLEEAKKLGPDNARILSDLGTAYLEKSRTIPDEQGGEQLKMRAMALEEFEKAVEADPKMPEAVFNRSICRQLLALPFQTRQSWQDYLDLDPSSKWADEARRRLAQVETTSPGKNSDELLQDFMTAYRARDDENAYRIVSRNREMITGKLIPQRLAKLITESDGDQKTGYISALEYIGKLENERSGDPFFAEMGEYYSSVSPTKLPLLAKAQNAVFQGYDLSAKNDHAAALKPFEEASFIFASEGDKWNAAICEYWVGYTLNRLNQVAESTNVLEKAVEPNKHFKWIASQYYNWLSINMATTRQMSMAIEYNRKSLDLSEQTSDLYLSEKTLAAQGEIFRLLGQYDRSLALTSKNLQLTASPDASLRQKWRDLNSAASLFFVMKLYRTAAFFQSEAMDLAAGPMNEKTFVSQSGIKLGQIYGAEGRFSEASVYFDRGIRIAEDFSDTELSAKTVADARLRRAHMYRESGDCIKAVTDYDAALRFYGTEKFPAYTYNAYKGRLLCFLESENTAAFQAELPTIFGFFRDYRTKITEEENRNAFFAVEQDIYDIATDYEFRQQNMETAFNYSEASRARSLLDMQTSLAGIVHDSLRPEIKFSSELAEPLTLSALQPEIPEGVQVVQYSVLSDKTIIWLITRDTFRSFKSDIPANELRRKVLAYIGAVAKRDTAGVQEVVEGSNELYRILLEPVRDALDPAKEVCFIPDKVLFRLPFAALISPDSGKYFLAEHTLTEAPSLNVFINSVRQADARAQRLPETILSIGNPAFDKKDFPGLPDLEAARPEAEKIAGLGDGNILLTGKNASKARVLAGMQNAAVIHFGGHYLVNEGSPLVSGFVLSPDPGSKSREDSILANYEITADKLSNARLIVLAACETGVETYYNGEGMIGAARTFLAAGVPLVVASQWAVDSEATARLMVQFHRYRKTGQLSTAGALRRAQLDLLEEGSDLYRDPYYWAGFVTFGGYAQF